MAYNDQINIYVIRPQCKSEWQVMSVNVIWAKLQALTFNHLVYVGVSVWKHSWTYGTYYGTMIRTMERAALRHTHTWWHGVRRSQTTVMLYQRRRISFPPLRFIQPRVDCDWDLGENRRIQTLLCWKTWYNYFNSNGWCHLDIDIYVNVFLDCCYWSATFNQTNLLI